MVKNVRYPVGEQSFEALRERDCVYVDKTRFIEKLIEEGGKYFFLARPRRFGKSLFLSTLKCFFEGNRELFRGLYIDSVDWDWKTYPVLYLDLNILNYNTESSFRDIMEDSLQEWEQRFDIKPRIDNISIRFKNVIKGAYEKTRLPVVILVDEYDKPMVNNLQDKEAYERFRDELSSVYGNFKSGARYIKMVFLTGVSRFAHLSVFSGLNNISDISFLHKYEGICGITESELKDNFEIGMKSLSESLKMSAEETDEVLKKKYDGYHFCCGSEDIYNPYSVLNVFDKQKLENYWIKSGIPTLLSKMLIKHNIDLKILFESKCSEDALENLDYETFNPEALLYQTGYLTIKDFENGVYTLGIPNEEVKEGFLNFLLPKYTSIPNDDSQFFINSFVAELRKGDYESFMRKLTSMFADIPYEMRIEQERDLHNILLIFMMLIGLNVKAEHHTSNGRIDLFIKTERFYYIIELKIDKSAREALDQINRKDYALPFSTDGKKSLRLE